MNNLPKTYKIKGWNFTFKVPTEKDADALANFGNKVFSETAFLNRCPADGLLNHDTQTAYLSKTLSNERNLILVVECENRIVAQGILTCHSNKIKEKHRASLGISVLESFWKLGLGTLLMEHLINFASEKQYEQIELTVITTNTAAIALYKKFNFEIVGTNPHAQKLENGKFQDTYSMIKFL